MILSLIKYQLSSTVQERFLVSALAREYSLLVSREWGGVFFVLFVCCFFGLVFLLLFAAKLIRLIQMVVNQLQTRSTVVANVR